VTFVTVGNATQPFDRLLQAVERLAREGGLPEPIVVQSGHNPGFVSRVCVVHPFLKMEEFEEHVASATLVIGHAGAGTVVHALAAGRMPVLMPRRARYGEHVDDHQADFVRRLASERRVVPAWEPADLAAAVMTARAAHTTFSARTGPLVSVVARAIDDLIASHAMGRGRGRA
jgi:UDP-N-acetylglucosamine transferase subunit ALG13